METTKKSLDEMFASADRSSKPAPSWLFCNMPLPLGDGGYRLYYHAPLEADSIFTSWTQCRRVLEKAPPNQVEHFSRHDLRWCEIPAGEGCLYIIQNLDQHCG